MDESVINGANLFFPAQFGLVPPPGKGATREQWLIGLVNSAPAVSAGHILRHYVLMLSHSYVVHSLVVGSRTR